MSSPSGREPNKSNSLGQMGRPRSAESRGVKPKYKRRGSPFTKIANIFKRERNTENGSIPVRPACFVDDRYDRRSASPEGSNSTNHFKRRPGKDKPGNHHLWRPKVTQRSHLMCSSTVSSQWRCPGLAALYCTWVAWVGELNANPIG